MCFGAAAAVAAAGGVWLWGKPGGDQRKLHDLEMHRSRLKYVLEELDEDVLLKEAHFQQLQDQLAAAWIQQNAAQAQEVTRLQRQVADLHAELANQTGIIRQSQQNRRELTQQHEAAQAGVLPCIISSQKRERLAREIASVVAREHALVQCQAGQASAAAEEEARLVRQLDAQRLSLLKQNMRRRHASKRLEANLKHEQDSLAAGQAQLAEETQDRASSKALMLKHKGLLSKREEELNRREEGITAHTAEVSERNFKLDDLELIRMRGERSSWLKQIADNFSEISHTRETLSGMIIKGIEKWGGTRFAGIVTDNASNMQKTRRLVLKRFPHMIEVRCMMHAFITTMASAALQDGEQHLHADKARLAALEETLKEEYEEKSALQQQLKEERQAHAKACHPTASLTQLEGPVPAADRGLTPPPPPASQADNPAAAGILPLPFASGGFGFTLRPEMLRRLGNRDGNPFGQQASGHPPVARGAVAQGVASGAGEGVAMPQKVVAFVEGSSSSQGGTTKTPTSSRQLR
ncbi:hypothetical protein WJX77_001743 [Trebouxia sp. C0004]